MSIVTKYSHYNNNVSSYIDVNHVAYPTPLPWLEQELLYMAFVPFEYRNLTSPPHACYWSDFSEKSTGLCGVCGNWYPKQEIAALDNHIRQSEKKK